MYAVLGNRAIRESWIDVSEETFNLFLDGFNQFLIIQDEQFNIQDSLRRDVSLFKNLLKLEQAPNSQPKTAFLQLKGAGYFLSDEQFSLPSFNGQTFTWDRFSNSSQALRNLKSNVRSTYGEHFIEQRIALARESLHKMKLSAAKVSLPGLSTDIYPAYISFASTSYDDAMMSLSALQLLQSGSRLLPGSYWPNAGPAFLLNPEESLYLRSIAVGLEKDMLRLLNSPRSDWGFSFIVGMARLASIEASLSSGKLVFLDIFPGVDLLHSPRAASVRRYLPAMRREAEESFLLKRKEFFAGTEMREADFTALELLGNELLEIERSLEYDLQPRRLPETSIPSRHAWVSGIILPDMSENDLRPELAAAIAVENEYAKAISTLYEYDLLRRNCVTEIFAFINKSLKRHSAAKIKSGQIGASSDSESVRNESLQRLGGYVDATRGLNFIPAISAAEVDACYTVTAKREQPSYRSARLAEMKKHESFLLVFLRESNTLTSTIYHRSPDDSPFLFFTDDTVLLRPVFGVFNLLAGIGESLLGLVTLPVEGSNRLYLGAKGIMFSLPELIFINLRKGTMEYVTETR